MKRQIITIDPNRCNGCGSCITGCPEGALQMIDGKARLVSDLFCDGLGACIGTCPQGAITIEEREAEAYDERRTMENIIPHGNNTIQAHLRHLLEHGEMHYLNTALAVLAEKGITIPGFENTPEPHEHHGGCPGSRMRHRPAAPVPTPTATPTPGQTPSALTTWPVQLQLINPQAPFLDNADLVITADCVPFAYAGYHNDFLPNKIPLVFCPKLDRVIDQYIAKLAAIFSLHPIRSLTILRMEVPCCSGVTTVVSRAQEAAGTTIPVKERIISVEGRLLPE